MVNMSEITQEVERLLKNGLPKYIITRNKRKNTDANRAADGWIGIYRAAINYEADTAAGNEWLAHPDIIIHVQRASLQSEEDAEEKLHKSEKDVVEILSKTENLSLNGKVNIITGYSIEYDYNMENNIHFSSAIITLSAEVRTKGGVT